MNKISYFIGVEIFLSIVIAYTKFKNPKDFLICLYSFVFSGYYVFLKKPWDEHFERSFRFIVFIFILGACTAINILVFRFVIH